MAFSRSAVGLAVAFVGVVVSAAAAAHSSAWRAVVRGQRCGLFAVVVAVAVAVEIEVVIATHCCYLHCAAKEADMQTSFGPRLVCSRRSEISAVGDYPC